jgi:hypothetical protein
MRLFIFLCICCLAGSLSAQIESKQIKEARVAYQDFSKKLEDSAIVLQYDTSSKALNGSLTVNQDERLEVLLQDYVDSKKIKGFRIQLFSGNSRWEAVKVKSDFLKKYKEEKAPHLVYQSPNFKIRVGDYRNRLEAQKFLERYKADYPSAFIVQDEIEVGSTKE